ncbi:MAG: Gfo/Idh/MocA family oxidoreductase [Eubacteriales bacterium]|nr:Gfo/Idh/MocA family oxidoreductase [Eubacteriales bacterium]
MEKTIRWGIMGAGAVIHRWIKGALQAEDSEIVAIASRHKETAQAMAEVWDIPQVMTYDELLACPDIDIVYIAVPHVGHKELALRAMRAGKHVLLEKPATINAGEFRELMECAKEQQVFLMEAVWTRFFPIIKRALEEIKKGRIGEVRSVESSFAFRVAEDDDSRLVKLELAGGSLLDVGVYNLHFAHMIYGKSPVRVTGFASMDTDAHHYQVDEQAAYIGQYDKGELALMMSAIRTETPQSARIYGTEGYMELPIFWKPTRLEIVNGDKKEVIELPVAQKIEGLEDEGYQYEVRHVNGCIRKDLKESDVMPWQTTLEILTQMDQLRQEWGLVFPQEIR